MLKVIMFFVILCALVSCRQWPALYVGNTSGTLDYDRRSGVLHVEWCHNSYLNGTQSKPEASDTISAF